VPGSHELSIETGLEAYQIERVRNAAGALGTVLNNLAALGAGLLVPVTAIGDDGHGYDLLREVRKLPIDTAHILCLPDRLTPTYTKPMRWSTQAQSASEGPADQWQELNRLDVRTRAPLAGAATAEVCRRTEQVFRSSDCLIVLDQLVDEDCGVVSAAVRDTLARLVAEDPRKLLYVDSRRFLGRFAAGVLKGNRGEVLAACGESEASDQALFRSLDRLSRKTGRPAFCTLGERGILVARPDDEPTVVPGYPANGPTDIVGAGDAATSGIVSALLSGANDLEAAAFGNLVASITVQQLGTTGTASPEQVRARWGQIE
jgi:bifunctional ADP-heptose synthase (sugar kinase/adenylyltransferase)